MSGCAATNCCTLRMIHGAPASFRGLATQFSEPIRRQLIVTGCRALCWAENMEVSVASPALVKLEYRDSLGRHDPLFGAPPKMTIEKGRYRVRQGHLTASDPDLIGRYARLQGREWVFIAETERECRNVGFGRRRRVECAIAIKPTASHLVIGIGLLPRGQLCKRNGR